MRPDGTPDPAPGPIPAQIGCRIRRSTRQTPCTVSVVVPTVATGAEVSLLRRGTRLLWRAVRAHPRLFVISVSGATLFATMSVGGTWVLGRVTDRVIVPGFEDGVSGTTAALGAAAILGVALLRSLGVVIRRYWGSLLVRSTQRTWFLQVTDRYLRFPLSYFGSHPTGRLMAHADADIERSINAIMPLPFTVGVVVLLVLSVISLALIDPLLMLVGLALFPALGLVIAATSNVTHTKGVAPLGLKVAEAFARLTER